MEKLFRADIADDTQTKELLDQYKSLSFLNNLNPALAQNIMKSHSKLTKKIDNASDTIKKIVSEHENDFMAAFE